MELNSILECAVNENSCNLKVFTVPDYSAFDEKYFVYFYPELRVCLTPVFYLRSLVGSSLTLSTVLAVVLNQMLRIGGKQEAIKN